MSESSYSTLAVPNAVQPVNLQDTDGEVAYEAVEIEPTYAPTEVIVPPIEEVEITPDVEAEVIPVEEAVEDEKKERKPRADKGKKRKESPAEKRVKALVAEKNAEKAGRLALEARIRELEAGHAVQTHAAHVSRQETLESAIASLEANVLAAMDDSDNAKAVTLNKELMQKQMQLAAVTDEITSFKEPVIITPEAPAPDTADKAMEWVSEYPQFRTDEEFRSTSLILNRGLLSEGYDPHGDEFYTELNKRMGRYFPDLFGIDAENSVQYEAEGNPSSEETLTDSQSPSTGKTPQSSTPRVSGASRSPSATTPGKAPQKNKVRMTESDQVLARRWGADLQELAKTKKHIETNTGEDGYTPIKIV